MQQKQLLIVPFFAYDNATVSQMTGRKKKIMHVSWSFCICRRNMNKHVSHRTILLPKRAIANKQLRRAQLECFVVRNDVVWVTVFEKIRTYILTCFLLHFVQGIHNQRWKTKNKISIQTLYFQLWRDSKMSPASSE